MVLIFTFFLKIYVLFDILGIKSVYKLQIILTVKYDWVCLLVCVHVCLEKIHLLIPETPGFVKDEQTLYYHSCLHKIINNY